MICLILDRSGSMEGRQNDVIGGVNSFIDEQKKLAEPASMAFCRFDTGAIERFRPMTDLKDVKHLGADDFVPRGGTPLLDAIGQTINALDDDWKKEKPDRAICIVVTDGEENSSREFTKTQIKQMIQARQDSGLWAFIYLGANVDAFAEAGAMGYATSNTAGYTSSSKGTANAYSTVSASVSTMRTSGATFADNLGKDLGEGDDATVQPTPPPKVSATWTKPTGTPSTPSSGRGWTPPV